MASSMRWQLVRNMSLVFVLGIGGLYSYEQYQVGQMTAIASQHSVTNEAITIEVIRENEQLSANYDFEAIEPLNLLTRHAPEYASQLSHVDLPKDYATNDEALSGGATKLDPNEVPALDPTLPVVGGLSIPDVDMTLPVYQGLDNVALYYGAGTVNEGQKLGQGNYAVASHLSKHYGLLFEPLERVKVGQKVYLTDLSKVYEYEVFSVKMVSAYDLSVLENDPLAPVVTLITCTPNNNNVRLVVQARLKGSEVVTNNQQLVNLGF